MLFFFCGVLLGVIIGYLAGSRHMWKTLMGKRG